jgi:subfamily B ATP-binding cassette protein MsbA
MKVAYQKEFFDREYSVRSAYARVWRYARVYRLRIVVGLLCGVVTAGTLLPFFQVVQPALRHVESAAAAPAASEPTAPVVAAVPSPPKAIAKKAKLPSWYAKAERIAGRMGIALQTQDGGMAGALLLLVCVVVPFVAFVRLLMMFLNHYCLSWAGSHIVADIRQEMLAHVQRQGLQFFGRVDVGQLMSRVSADPQQIQTILTTILPEVATAPFEIAVAVGYIAWFAVQNDMLPTLALLFIGFPLFVIPIHALGRSIKRWSRRSMERNSMIGAKIHEILTCIKVVKSYHTEEHENKRFRETNTYLLKSTMRGLRIGLLVGPCVETIGILMICGFLVWCFLMNVKLSDVVPMLAPLLVIYKPVKQLSKLQVQVETSMAALNRIFSLMDVDMSLPARSTPVRKTSFDEAVRFEEVCFRYATGDKDAVHRASFEIARGQTVAVVGGTGSGKSTMAGLLSRFYDPQSGRIAIDGVDVRDLDAVDLHRLVGAVTQEALLFNATIEENIRYGSFDATHEQVVAAAKLANAHDFIVAQPGGYDRVVGEKGFSLSGGERQRIAIARAILRNPPILILDEATSALDTVTERLVQEALTRLMANRTTFAIAHRLSTIRHADLILVMRDGEIVERGTHESLLASGGLYRQLCEMQEADTK